MKRKTFVLFLGVAALAWADDALPKAETILDRYVEVTGGKAAYESRKNEVANGVVSFPAMGLKGNVTQYLAAPDKSYFVFELEGIGKIEQGSANGVAWDKNPMLGPRVKSGEELAQALREGTFNEPINWRKLYSKVETAGMSTVDGDECYKVVFTPNAGKPETKYFSKKSGFVVKTELVAVSPMGELPVEGILSDYKDFDGIKMPSKIIQRQGQQEIVVTFQSVKFNVDLPADRFDPPEDIKALLKK
jgi:hypothetical protein